MTTVIDASGAILGRLSTNIAKRLLDGEEIAVVNSEKAIISGKKTEVKKIYKQKRDVGTYRKGPFFPRMPDKIVKRTVRGMLPYQKPRGKEALKRLKCYIGVNEDLKDEEFENIKDSEKKPLDYITLEELSRSLGAKI